MSRVFYRQLSIVISVLGGILAGAIFKQIWSSAEDEAPGDRRLATAGWRRS